MGKLKDAILNRKEYSGLSWFENFMGGHLNLGPITIYGENAMHWGVQIWTKRFGYVCFRLPFRCFGDWWSLYFYLSPDATPSSSTFYIGRNKTQRKLSKIRRVILGGHNKTSKDGHKLDDLLESLIHNKGLPENLNKPLE